MGAFPLEKNFGFRIYHLARLYRLHFIHLTREVGPDIYPEQWIVLNLLHQRGRVPQAELVDFLFQDRPTLTRMLRTMETRGWISRKRIKNDGRRISVSLTPSGKKMYARLFKLARGVRPDLYRGIDERMTRSFMRVIGLLERNVVRAMDADGRRPRK